MNLDLQTIALLVGVALGAGILDAIAGGGGLLTLPALLTAGLPPHQALGTNKGQSVFGTASALWTYGRAGALDRERARITFPAGLAGSLAGAFAVNLIPPATLRPLVMILLVLAAATLLIRRPSPAAPASDRRIERRTSVVFALALCIGAYDGFFGPGTGTFLIVGFVTLFAEPLVRATADAKVVNFASNLAAVLMFGTRGQVLWAIALPMAAAQILGGAIGARLAVRGGERIIKTVVLCVVAALWIKLGWDLYADR